MKRKPTYAEKMQQANREAKVTVVALLLTVIVWIALGFGVAPTGIEVFHTPLWIITGTVGTWVFAIIVAVFMSKRVIVDVDLDDESDTKPCLASDSEAGDSRE